MVVDFHSHILPCMDDGAKSMEQSLEMLRVLASDGVETVMLTPHFYLDREDLSSFLQRREGAYNALKKATEGISSCPELRLGSEVYFFSTLAELDLTPLCIQGTDILLLELPFFKFNDTFYTQLANFVSSSGKEIMIAHIDRYIAFNGTGVIDQLNRACNNPYFQLNCSALTEEGLISRIKYLRLLSNGRVHVLGSDAHNMGSRKPEYGKAALIIKNKLGQNMLESINAMSDNVFAAGNKKPSLLIF